MKHLHHQHISVRNTHKIDPNLSKPILVEEEKEILITCGAARSQKEKGGEMAIKSLF